LAEELTERKAQKKAKEKRINAPAAQNIFQDEYSIHQAERGRNSVYTSRDY
jgi:hypothetical protein